ncbi:MAG: hypothetical protein WC402_05375, partial [Candidatus Pacearchaeota archaeon]
MAYKRYFNRNGKKIGPYYYESYRDESGKVRKRYVGTTDPDADNKSFITPTYNLGNFLFFICLTLLVLSVFYSFSAGLNEIGKSSFTGFAIAENTAESSGLVYVGIENETTVEKIGTNSIDLEIKEPVKFGTQAISKNKNKRMDFDTAEGKIRLYFDLLNYSEFVENLADEVNGTIILNKTSQNLTLTNETVVNETITNQTILNETNININHTEILSNFSNISEITSEANLSIVNQTNETITAPAVNETIINQTVFNETAVVNSTIVNETIINSNLTQNETVIISDETNQTQLVEQPTENQTSQESLIE